MKNWFFVQMPLMDDAGGSGGGGGESTGSVISAALSEAGAAGTIPTDGDGPMEVAEAKPAEAPPPSPEDQAEEAELAKLQAELKAKDPKLAGKIDVDRHQAVLTRARNKAKAELDAAVAKHAEELKSLEWAKDPEAQAAIRALSLADSDPQKFVELLMRDERYAGMISLKQAKEAVKELQAASDGRPKPNAKAGDIEYYDNDGLGQLLDFERQRAVREAKEEMMKEFGPLRDEFQARNEWNKSVQNARQTLTEARETWPGFKEHEKAVGEAMKKDERLSLEAAYRQVVVKELQAKTAVNEAELRKKILAELEGKKAAAESPGKQGLEYKAGDKEQETTGDTIRAALRQDRLI